MITFQYLGYKVRWVKRINCYALKLDSGGEVYFKSKETAKHYIDNVLGARP